MVIIDNRYIHLLTMVLIDYNRYIHLPTLGAPLRFDDHIDEAVHVLQWLSQEVAFFLRRQKFHFSPKLKNGNLKKCKYPNISIVPAKYKSCKYLHETWSGRGGEVGGLKQRLFTHTMPDAAALHRGRGSDRPPPPSDSLARVTARFTATRTRSTSQI